MNLDNTQTLSDSVTTPGATYVGISGVGRGKSEAVWQIKKIVDDGNGNVSVTYANKSAEFKNIWNNRASLDYSIPA